MWKHVMTINDSVTETLQSLHDDLQMAERLQKAKLPKRFPSIKGFQISSRYLAGMRSGGDHFDLAESKDKAKLSLVFRILPAMGFAAQCFPLGKSDC